MCVPREINLVSFSKKYPSLIHASQHQDRKSQTFVSFKQTVQTEEVAVVKLPKNGENQSKIRCSIRSQTSNLKLTLPTVQTEVM